MQACAKTLISAAEDKKLATLPKAIFNSLNDIQAYISTSTYDWFCHLSTFFENSFGKVANFLASADIRVLVAHACMFAMLLLIGLAPFYAPGGFLQTKYVTISAKTSHVRTW